jgi:hypothetical protein
MTVLRFFAKKLATKSNNIGILCKKDYKLGFKKKRHFAENWQKYVGNLAENSLIILARSSQNFSDIKVNSERFLAVKTKLRAIWGQYFVHFFPRNFPRNFLEKRFFKTFSAENSIFS